MKHAQKIILLAGLLVFATLTQFYIFDSPKEPWFDSAFSLETAHQLQEGSLSLQDFQSHDVHPPVFYAILAGWQQLRIDSLFTEYQWAQELSVLLGFIFLLCMYLGLRNFFPSQKNSGVIEAIVLFMGMSTMLVHYATEPRMYIMLLALSGIAFLAVSKRMQKDWAILGYAAVFLMPLVHYFAALGIVVFPAMHWYVNNSNWRLKSFIASGFIGFVLTLFFAIPQRMRSTGTWFKNHDITSWPSAMTYTFSANGTMEIGHSLFSGIFHVAVLVLVVVVLYGAVVRLTKAKNVFELDRPERAWYFMMTMIMIPFGYLFFLTFGSGGFFNLYHHRFFLVVTWMFAAAVLFAVIGTIAKYLGEKEMKKKVGALVAFMVLFGMFAGLQVAFQNNIHTELQNMAYATPCPENRTVLIGHESPFSAIPYQVFERERGCQWEHFISTNISEGLLNAGGYDAFEGKMYWNKTLPTQGFYYLKSKAEFFNLTGRNTTTRELDEGIWLEYVHPETSRVTITFG